MESYEDRKRVEQVVDYIRRHYGDPVVTEIMLVEAMDEWNLVLVDKQTYTGPDKIELGQSELAEVQIIRAKAIRSLINA